MAKKKYYDEDGKQIRSRTTKPFYKKWPFWIIIFCSVLFSAIGFYIISGEEKLTNEPIEKREVKKEVEKKDETENDSNSDDKKVKEKEKETTQTYTYEDFKGTYIEFEGEPYKSPITGMADVLTLGDSTYNTFNRWDTNLTSTIKKKSISESTLTTELNNYEDEINGRHSKTGTEQFDLRYEGNMKVLYLIGKNRILYSISKEDLQNHYTQSEIDYARIIMTIRGVPSLDSWAVYNTEYDGDKPIIGVEHNNKGDFIPGTTDEGDVVYPEEVTTLYLKNKTRLDDISYTYASIKNGYIRVYPVPLNHALKTGEEVIDEAKEYAIKPFEPFEVADFIGHIEFSKE